MQTSVIINNIEIPVIDFENVKYYPIPHIMVKLLMKKTDAQQISKSVPIKQFLITYGKGNMQTTNCISEEHLKYVISKSKIGRLNTEQKIAMNELRKYLKMDILEIHERFLDNISNEEIEKYDLFTQDCIYEVMKENQSIKWQRCYTCGKYYPYHDCFYSKSAYGDNLLFTTCRICISNGVGFKHIDESINHIYKVFGKEIYLAYKNHDTIKIYEHWSNLKTYHKFPEIINNKEDFKIIIKCEYDKGSFGCDYVNMKFIDKTCRIKCKGIVSLREIYELLYDIKLVGSDFHIDNFDDAKTLFFTYLKSKNMHNEDPYIIKYNDDVFKPANLILYINKYNDCDMLSFLLKLYDYKLAPYKFNYYDKFYTYKENRVHTMKYFIEEDMKIQIDKVPLYITLTSIQQFPKTRTLYYICKRYYKSLFDWINEVYPDKFEPKDFNINYYRNDFDSVEESQINDMLKNNLKNILYNPRNTDRTITIADCIPDWIVFTNTNTYIIEYFGLVQHGSKSKRVVEYTEKMNNKIDIYNKLFHYKFIYIYPQDFKNNFEGLKSKIDVIIKEQNN